MTVKTIYKNICDRCGEEFQDNHWEWRIGKLKWKRYKKTFIGRLSWMVMRNGSGSQDSWMSLDLCTDCAGKFVAFMKMKNKED